MRLASIFPILRSSHPLCSGGQQNKIYQIRTKNYKKIIPTMFIGCDTGILWAVQINFVLFFPITSGHFPHSKPPFPSFPSRPDASRSRAGSKAAATKARAHASFKALLAHKGRRRRRRMKRLARTHARRPNPNYVAPAASVGVRLQDRAGWSATTTKLFLSKSAKKKSFVFSTELPRKRRGGKVNQNSL